MSTNYGPPNAEEPPSDSQARPISREAGEDRPGAAGPGEYRPGGYPADRHGPGGYEAGYGPAGYGYGPAGHSPGGYGGPGGYGAGYHGSGEYGPSGYGPSGYGPSGYGPSGYGPSGYGPSGYGPSGYGPSGYGPPGYAPGGYQGGAYGPAGYGPGGYGQGPQPGRPGRRWRFRALAAGAAAVVAAAAFVGTRSAVEAATGDRTLTTAQIAAQTDPGLVDVVSTLGYQQGEAAGTGMVLTSSGEVLTNNHVINGATAIRVTDIGNGRTYRATVVGYDKSKDIAVLQLQNASGLKTVTLGNSASAQAGQTVTALGNAGGKGGIPSVATGKITGLNAVITASDESSGTSERLTGLIHHNANIQPGDSGGPLVSSSGQVIGIDTAASTGYQFASGQNQAKTQAFAIPINQATAIARQIESHTASATVHIGATAFLGVEVTSSASSGGSGFGGSTQGSTIAGVLSGGPAATAGLTAGDTITAVGGRPVTSPNTLQSALESHHPGDSVRLSWTDQAGQSQSATVQLGTGPAD